MRGTAYSRSASLPRLAGCLCNLGAKRLILELREKTRWKCGEEAPSEAMEAARKGSGKLILHEPAPRRPCDSQHVT